MSGKITFLQKLSYTGCGDGTGLDINSFLYFNPELELILPSGNQSISRDEVGAYYKTYMATNSSIKHISTKDVKDIPPVDFDVDVYGHTHIDDIRDNSFNLYDDKYSWTDPWTSRVITNANRAIFNTLYLHNRERLYRIHYARVGRYRYPDYTMDLGVIPHQIILDQLSRTDISSDKKLHTTSPFHVSYDIRSSNFVQNYIEGGLSHKEINETFIVATPADKICLTDMLAAPIGTVVPPTDISFNSSLSVGSTITSVGKTSINMSQLSTLVVPTITTPPTGLRIIPKNIDATITFRGPMAFRSITQSGPPSWIPVTVTTPTAMTISGDIVITTRADIIMNTPSKMTVDGSKLDLLHTNVSTGECNVGMLDNYSHMTIAGVGLTCHTMTTPTGILNVSKDVSFASAKQVTISRLDCETLVCDKVHISNTVADTITSNHGILSNFVNGGGGDDLVEKSNDTLLLGDSVTNPYQLTLSDLLSRIIQVDRSTDSLTLLLPKYSELVDLLGATATPTDVIKGIVVYCSPGAKSPTITHPTSPTTWTVPVSSVVEFEMINGSSGYVFRYAGLKPSIRCTPINVSSATSATKSRLIIDVVGSGAHSMRVSESVTGVHACTTNNIVSNAVVAKHISASASGNGSINTDRLTLTGDNNHISNNLYLKNNGNILHNKSTYIYCLSTLEKMLLTNLQPNTIVYKAGSYANLDIIIPSDLSTLKLPVGATTNLYVINPDIGAYCKLCVENDAPSITIYSQSAVVYNNTAIRFTIHRTHADKYAIYHNRVTL